MDVDVVAGKILGAEKAPAACRAHCLRRLMENGRKQVDTGVGLGGEGGVEEGRFKDTGSVPSHRLWGLVMWQAEG